MTEALKRLHEAGRVRSPWLPGMVGVDGARLLVIGASTYQPGRLRAKLHDRAGLVSVGPEELPEPDLTDPATVGCLLALLREAEGDPGANTRPSSAGRWYVHLPNEDTWATDSGAETEAEAVAAALVACAKAAP